MDDVIGKLLQDNNMPDTPTARAIYKKMLEPDGDAPLTLNGVALYPRRKWVGLTDEEIHNLDLFPHKLFDQERLDFARAIEAKLKDKNNG